MQLNSILIIIAALVVIGIIVAAVIVWLSQSDHYSGD
jgi:hypothetical protein